MPELPNKQTVSTSSPLSPRATDDVTRRILDADLRRCSRERRLFGFLSILETAASAERAPGKSAQDILSWLWGVWQQNRQVPLSRPDLQFSPDPEGLAAQAMAARFCVYWDGHPQEHQIHRSLHSQVSRKGPRGSRQLEQEASAWREWYARTCYLYEKQRLQAYHSAVCVENRGQYLRARSDDERSLRRRFLEARRAWLAECRARRCQSALRLSYQYEIWGPRSPAAQIPRGTKPLLRNSEVYE